MTWHGKSKHLHQRNTYFRFNHYYLMHWKNHFAHTSKASTFTLMGLCMIYLFSIFPITLRCILWKDKKNTQRAVDKVYLHVKTHPRAIRWYNIQFILGKCHFVRHFFCVNETFFFHKQKQPTQFIICSFFFRNQNSFISLNNWAGFIIYFIKQYRCKHHAFTMSNGRCQETKTIITIS